MTEIEQKAMALLNECGWGGAHLKRAWNPRYEALCRAIEQHEAFKRDVSDAIQSCMLGPVAEERLSPFILPKPVDPLVEAWLDAFPGNHREDSVEECEKIRAALAKRGLEVREIDG